MVHRKALEKAGYSDEKLKSLFTSDDPPDGVKRLIELNSRRIDDEVQRNLREAPVYRAIDAAYDVAPNTIFHSLVNDMLGQGCSASDITAAFRSRPEGKQLERMLVPALNNDNEPLKDKDGNAIMRLDLPIFVNVLLPLVASYLTARWSSLWAERDRHPLFKYEPLRNSRINRAKTKIVTSIIDRVGNDLGYRADLRTALQQALKYGRCMVLPQEPYYVERQCKPDGEEYVVAEGMRMEIPHISRSFIDQAHRHTTSNFNTGSEYGGYWTVRRYGDVASDKSLWNADKIKGGYSDDMIALWNWWRMLEPCQLKFPTCGASPKDRITDAFLYTQANEDDAVTLVPFFHRIIPKDWDLYDYEYPVWHRLLFAGPSTVVHAAPLSYNPLTTFLYDYDPNSVRPRSLALELMPWQDQLGNLLTQYIVSVRANADRVVFWNADVVDQKDINAMGIAGDRKVKGTVYIPYSRNELRYGMQDKNDIFSSFTPPPFNTAEIGSAVGTLLSTMERALSYSPQEVGGSATHEQSAHEIRVIQQNVSGRQQLTSSHFRDAEQSWKKAAYESYVQADTGEEFDAIIDNADEDLIAAAKELGFTVEENDTKTSLQVTIRGKREALELDAFASELEGADRMDDTKIAVAMVQAFQTMFSNPAIVQQVGVEQLVSMFNQMLGYIGVPVDFRLRVKTDGKPGEEEQQAQAAAIAQQLKAITEGTDAKLKQLVEQMIVPMGQKTSEAVEGLSQALAKLAQQLGQIGQVTAAGAQKDMVQDQAIKLIVDQVKKISMIYAQNQPQPPLGGAPIGPQIPLPPPGMAGPPPAVGVPVGPPSM